MDADDVVLRLQNALSGVPEELTLLRLTVCRESADWLAEAGDALWAVGHLAGDNDAKAVGILTQMAGQLGQAATDAHERERWYAAAALTRQLVESHYLLARFRDDPPDRARWLSASPNRIEKSFRPGRMRAAGGFRLTEYKQHCSWGGHPGPSASWLLPNHAGAPIHPRLLAVDLAQHLTEYTDLVMQVVDRLGDCGTARTVIPSSRPDAEALELWRALDPLARRLILPESD